MQRRRHHRALYVPASLSLHNPDYSTCRHPAHDGFAATRLDGNVRYNRHCVRRALISLCQRLRAIYGRQRHGRRMALARRRRKLYFRHALAAQSALRDHADARSRPTIYRYAFSRRYLGTCISARHLTDLCDEILSQVSVDNPHIAFTRPVS